MIGSIALISSAKLLIGSCSSGKLRISYAHGRVSGFLSKSFSIRPLIRGGRVEGISTGFESFTLEKGGFFVDNSNRTIPNAHMSAFVVPLLES